MGLFDLFKRKPTVTFETIVNTNNTYNPWDANKTNSKTDYSTAVFLSIHRSKPSRIPKAADEYARYVSYNLGINDPVKRFKELLRDGYFVEAPLFDVLSTLKVVELKKMLTDNGIEAKDRKKIDLIEKIQAHIPVDRISLPKMYVLSQKAKDFLEVNADLLKLYSNPYGITYEEYSATKGSQRNMSYNDVIWSVFIRRDMFSGGDYSTKCRNEYNKARFLKSENRLVDALRHYVHVLFLEMNDPTRIIPELARDDWDGEVMQISSDVLENIFELKEHFIPKMAEECYQMFNLKHILMKRNDFARLLNDIFQGNQIDAKNYLPKGCR